MEQFRVLVAHDSPELLEDITSRLKVCPEIEVIGTACDSIEAFVQAKDLAPRALLIDLDMPVVSGWEAIPILRKAFPAMGIIALGARDPDRFEQKARSVGANEFVSETRIAEDLLPAIRRVASDCRWRVPEDVPCPKASSGN